jgi:uncharacterized OB-fold protein
VNGALSTAPVVQGLFEGQGDATRLLASRCRGCGSVYFPRSLSCRHPRCTDKAPQDILLGPEGSLYSVTVQAYRPPPLFVMDDWAPYALGLIDMPEGLRIMAMLTGRPPQDWRIGEPVALTTGVLSRDGEGREVLTYQFRPLAIAGAATTAIAGAISTEGASA